MGLHMSYPTLTWLVPCHRGGHALSFCGLRLGKSGMEGAGFQVSAMVKTGASTVRGSYKSRVSKCGLTGSAMVSLRSAVQSARHRPCLLPGTQAPSLGYGAWRVLVLWVISQNRKLLASLEKSFTDKTNFKDASSPLSRKEFGDRIG